MSNTLFSRKKKKKARPTCKSLEEKVKTQWARIQSSHLSTSYPAGEMRSERPRQQGRAEGGRAKCRRSSLLCVLEPCRVHVASPELEHRKGDMGGEEHGGIKSVAVRRGGEECGGTLAVARAEGRRSSSVKGKEQAR
jgi:hypothetical protein